MIVKGPLDASLVLVNLYQGAHPEPGPMPFPVLVLAAMEYQPKSELFPGVREVIHAPLDDGRLSSVEIATAESAAARVAEHLRHGTPVLVTCWMGQNRSGLISAIALMDTYPHLSLERIIRAIRRARGEQALGNYFFTRYLTQRFESRQRRSA